MKKSLLVLAALAALSMVFVSCGGGDATPSSGPTTPDTPAEPVVLIWTGEIKLVDNYKYGEPETAENYLGQQTMVDAFSSFQFKAGQKIKVEITGTLDKAGEAIGINIIDNTSAANWWTELFSGNKEAIPAGVTEINQTIEFEIAKDATAVGAAKLQVFSSDPVGSNPTLNVTIKATIQ